MPAIKQSVCFNPFTGSGLSPQELVAAAVRIGYQSVEMASQEHWPLIQDHGLAIAHCLRSRFPTRRPQQARESRPHRGRAPRQH